MKLYLVLSLVVFVLVLVAAGVGVFYRTSGNHIEMATVRGDIATYQGNGLYRYDPAVFAREGVIWDAINLFIGLPLFGLGIYLSRKDSLRGKLLTGGFLFYFCYAYLMYSTGVALNPLFLVYIAIFGLCGVAFCLTLADIDLARLPGQMTERFPHRLFAGFTFVMSAVLVFLWLGRILPLLNWAPFPADFAGMLTMVSQALDLGMVVPLLLATGVLLLKRSAWGYLLTGVSMTHGMMMFISIPAWIVVPLIQDSQVRLIEAVPFLIVSLVGLALAGVYFRNVQATGYPEGA